jgi:hypothetical protein
MPRGMRLRLNRKSGALPYVVVFDGSAALHIDRGVGRREKAESWVVAEGKNRTL